MKTLRLLTFLFVFYSVTLFADNTAKAQMLHTISLYIHPEMAQIWDTFLSNFNEHDIQSWTFSEGTGQFTLHLARPLKLWVPPKPKLDEPKPGSILLFGVNNQVSGVIQPQNRTIYFNDGFYVYCKYKMGFITVPVTPRVYSFRYVNNQAIVLEAGQHGMSQKRTKTLNDYLVAWRNPQNVVEGDHVRYLNSLAK